MCENKLSFMFVDGKQIAESIKYRLKQKDLSEASLALVYASNSEAVHKFMSIKVNFAKSLGISVSMYDISEYKNTEEVVNLLKSLKETGIVVQLPLEKEFPSEILLDEIPFDKDVDVLSNKRQKSFKNASIEDVLTGKVVTPPVAGAILEILNYYNISLINKRVLVMGEGMLVGMPTKEMLIKTGAIVESINKDTDIKEILNKTISADIIVTGMGQTQMLKPGMIKEGVVLIDAGTSTRRAGGTLCGDIDLSCKSKADLFAKVPGGVGPVTVAKLFENLSFITQQL